ncbi:MAG: ATP-binding cassette domain-containing protein, partial [Gemmatimonadaceae bacterium]
EPTAVLSPPEVQELWRVLRRLTDEGGTVVLITHKLDEVIEISRNITVMRAGETVGRLVTATASPNDIAHLMVGRDVRLAGELVEEAAMARDGAVRAEGAPDSGAERPGAPVPALSVTDLVVGSSRNPREVDGISFDVRPGEVLGIAGVEGNGQTELVEAIAGLRRPSHGSIRMGSREVTMLSVRERADAGLSHIPEDRLRRGLVLDYSVSDNLILGLQHRFSERGVLSGERVQRNADERIAEFDVRPADRTLPAHALSGGNQQKVVLAREMRGREFSVLLASQPTRGVDVGAIEFIHAQLRAARDAGKAVLLVSADLVEVLALADRVAVMYEGKIVASLARGEATKESVGCFMTGATRTGNTGEMPTPDRKA